MSEKLVLELYERVATLENKVAALEKILSGVVIAKEPDTEAIIKAKGKYRNLSKYLAKSGKDVIDLTFPEIEEIIQDKLPPCARDHRANWSNTRSISLARSWMDVGYRTTTVNVEKEQVRFERALSNKSMSKYEPLGKYLYKTGQDRVVLDFAEIEQRILGFELIESLKKHEAAWYGTYTASPTHVWKKAWCAWGYQVERVSLTDRQVAFYKV